MSSWMKPIQEMPSDRKDGRLLHVSDGLKHYLARWSPGGEPAGGRFRCYDGGPCDLYLNPMTHWSDAVDGIETTSEFVRHERGRR